MFGIMLQKMWHKKWMNLCLLLGCILLSATVVSFPIYRAAAYDRMINEEFKSYVSTEGKWPTLIASYVASKKDQTGKTLKKMEEFPKTFYEKMQVEELNTFYLMSLIINPASSDTKRGDAQGVQIKLSSLDHIEDYSKIIAGEMYSEKGMDEDGVIEVIVSQSCLIDKGLLVGETFTYDDMKYKNKSPIKFKVVGVFDALPNSGYFWQIKPEKLNEDVFCNPNLFREVFTGEDVGAYTINTNIVAMFDFENITAKDVDRIVSTTRYFLDESAYKSVLKDPAYLDVIDSYQKKISRISTTLVILQVPVLVMLAAFLFMISGQMYEMEKNEISVIKSRGSSGMQIIRLYFYQGLVITLTGGLLGMPLGALFARVLGSTRNFLEFDFSQKLDVVYTKEAFIYLACAVLTCLLSITIPSLKHSRVSIVKLKQSKALKRKSWWEKLFIDVLLLGISLYGYYNFHKNMGDLSNDVLTGQSLDPLLYMSSSLFILGAGLFFLRIQPYIVKLIYIIGKKKWGPASYVSFSENIKNGRKQQLIMLFLIMTISLGMYHATVARTILDNAVENTVYLSGTDVVIQEVWVEITDRYGAYTGEFVVPDYSKYHTLEAAESYTRVINDTKGSFKDGGNTLETTILGINTREFGLMTSVSREYLENPYYQYLNDLAVVEDGVLVSSNFNKKLGYEIGDKLTYTSSRKKEVTGKIVGFVDYFPTYAAEEKGLNPDGTAYSKDNYLIVSHFDFLNKKWGTTPYEIWINLKDGYDATDIYNWIEENELSIRKYVNSELKLQTTLEDPLLQGTNGVLTMGFVVTILLCGVGYLIFWVMSIRERELMFGVLRATGFHKSEIVQMLLNEQIFCGVFSVFAGIGIGKLTSDLFVPILQQAYASQDQALPMKLITVASDMYRLYGVIAGVMITVLVVLIVILFKMNVTKALKLGEE